MALEVVAAPHADLNLIDEGNYGVAHVLVLDSDEDGPGVAALLVADHLYVLSYFFVCVADLKVDEHGAA